MKKKLVLKGTQNGCIVATEQDYILPKIILNNSSVIIYMKKCEEVCCRLVNYKLIMEYVIGLKKHGILDLI